jgi:translation initiation factor IF-3
MFCKLTRAQFDPCMSFELSGTVKEIFEEQTFASGFNKREFVITSEADKFPQEIKFECLKDKAELVNKLNKGDKVKVTFDINGREWNGKYFVNLAAWRVDAAGANDGASDEPPPFDPGDEVLDEEPPF